MDYLVTFLFCVLADVFSGKKYKIQHAFFVLWIFAFLCFGYMTGSDWRSYELMYSSESMMTRFEESEFGFIYLVRLFNLFTSDFWVFNAVMKIFYLDSLRRFFSQLFKYEWTAIGLSFTFGTLFILIDCPMRFMVAQTVLIYSSIFLLKGHWKSFCFLALISTAFHVTMIVPFVFMLSFPISSRFCQMNRFVIFFVYIVILYYTTSTFLYEYLFDSVIGLFGYSMAKFAQEGGSYSVFSVDSIYSIGTLKNLVLFVIILYYRDLIVASSKNGKYIYYFACLFFFVRSILGGIPTGFRLAIFISYFSIAAIVLVIMQPLKMKLKCIIYISFSVVLLKDVYSSWVFYPYSNSIPYIVTEHLPYRYRASYNYIEFPKLTGKSIE